MQLTIITGASRGIGKAIAEDLKTLEGEKILLSSEDVNFENPQAVFYLMEEKLKHINVETIDQVNIVLCAAQIGTKNNINTDELSKLYNINVLSNLNVIEAAITLPGKMRIVWFAGGGAAFPYPEFFGYSLTKTAVVRAVENLSVMFKDDDFSIIALAPGAVETDMLKTVLEAGCEVRTKTDISEPVNFVRKFITDEFNSLALNGRFLHVRDNLGKIYKTDMFKLRRIE
jgi:NAD(P)-dependent dehydrogenase (short-subunit alcohol dehydrogenase family)